MKLKIIQINIFKGKYLDNLVQFLKVEDADFITMQEVSRGIVSNHTSSVDIFSYLMDTLGLNGVFHNDVEVVGHPDVLHGNGVLTKYRILESSQIPLKRNRPLTVREFGDRKFFPVFPRSIVDAKVDVSGALIHALSLHGAWTAPPTDNAETLRQSELIAKHLKSLDEPFIMGADMNTTPKMQVIKLIEKAAQNFMKGSGIKRTTHPQVHKVAYKELLVDYIFASKEFKRLSIKAPAVLVSDHLPVVAEVELEI